MAFLARGRKSDLIEVAIELGEVVPSSGTIVDVKRIITESQNFDQEFVKALLERVIDDRNSRENEVKEKEREKEIREFELEKLRIQNDKNSSDFVPNINNEFKFIPAEMRNLMHKYDPNEGDISYFLILFERQAKRIDLNADFWVSQLLGLLPYEINQLIARESEEKANDYNHVKQLLLKRFKLSPEKFRQKFINHVKTPQSSWKDFAFELTNYFQEWLTGLQITDFQSLKNLIIANQLKKTVPFAIREHFIDEWSRINDPETLVEKLDEYETARRETKTTSFANVRSFPKSCSSTNNYSKNFKHYNASERNFYSSNNPSPKFITKSTIKNEKGLIKCYNCQEYGNHISRNCSKPKVERKEEQMQRAYKENQAFSVNKQKNDVHSSPFVKSAKINSSEPINCLLDTGSAISLLKHSIAQSLELPIKHESQELYGIGNINQPSAVTLGKTKVNIEVCDICLETTLYIVNDSAQPYDLIIGRDILDDKSLACGKIGDNFNIWYACDIPSTFFEKEKQVKLYTDHSIEIESNSLNFIEAKTAEIDNGMFLLNTSNEYPDLVLEIKDGKTKLPIINFGDKNVKFNINQCVGRAISISDEWELKELSEPKPNDNIIDKNICSVSNIKRNIKLEDINFGKSTTKDQKGEILKLLNDYRDVFAFDLSELGCTDFTKMDIKEIEGSKPVCARPYKTSASERNTIKEIVSEWKRHGIVSETRSPYASPVLLVKKKTGEQRLVCDFRKLNSQTVKDKYPLPRIDDILENLGGCKYFCTLDLAHGYLQIPLTEEAKLKTAFITPDETGQFERMIFGLANAPAEFQRLMSHVLGPLLLHTIVLCYLDDIIVPAKSWEEMVSKLRKVLNRIRDARLTLKLTKCEFGMKEVNFLGFIINESGIKPGLRKIKAIEGFSKPKNVHEIRRFLGLTGFFRRFIPKYAIEAEPLSRLTQKDKEFVWEEEQENSFQFLKNQLISEPVLAHYDPKAETEVHCDASAEGLSGMLMQRGEDGRWHLVYAVSKKTTNTEKNYHSSRLELMAIVWTLDRLRQFLIGISFVIITDCQALVYMNAKKSTNPQIARWCTLIQEYDFEIKHRPGKRLSHVDALSRAPVALENDTMTSILQNFEVCQTLTEDEQISMIQKSDPELQKIIEIIKRKSSDRTSEEKQLTKNYVYKKNRLFRRMTEDGKEKLLYVIPKAMRKSIVVRFHDLLGHFSVDRTVQKIKETYWFSGIKRYVRRHISACFECLLNKTPGGKRKGQLNPIKPGKRPFAIIHIDHLGPFVRSSKGNQELIVIIDNLTRFVRIYPVKSTSAKFVMKSIKEFVNDFGLPERIISDRGSCFTSEQFKQYCEVNGIQHTLNSTKHPQANGMVERANRTILSTITTGMTNKNHRDWDLRIKEVERNLNNFVNKTTNKTPFRMLHGYSPKFNDGILRILADEDEEPWTDPNEIQENARNTIEQQQRKMKERFDSKRCTITYDKGEIVVMRCAPKATGQPTKTQPKYRGPLIIVDVLPSDTYRVTELEGKERGRHFTTTAHVSQLKTWKCDYDSDDDDDSDSDPNNIPRRNPIREVRKKTF